ncbi:hypothetical protein HXX76_012239 [Chlamydomonas incerta]|uniref:Uncharacterized protein n=1 Tax=Chlamydomonas incerta TaxID=51695 RepID=A0A835VTU6_CHLIN|nr:hypothetical protein HXX76_012239 [Chlamydomonas incerta]|eukprot:KAG2427585.1 hypothetical protein HXX76_012239 [Chlamydomonas incerta]
MYGGAVFVGQLIKVISLTEGSMAHSNNASFDGGVFNSEGSLETMVLAGGAALHHNHAGSGSGGAIFIRQDLGSFLLTDGASINANAAGLHGGAVCVEQNMGSINISDSARLEANRAGADGGAIRVGGTADAVVLGNHSCVCGNSAVGDGGGFWFADAVGSMRLSDGVGVRNNTAASGSGGAFYLGAAVGVLDVASGSEVQNNGAGASGGAVHAAGAIQSLTVTNSTLQGNSAASRGGVLTTLSSITSGRLHYSALLSNSAGEGGVFFVGGAFFGSIELTTCNVEGNRALIGNGGVLAAPAVAAASPGGGATGSAGSSVAPAQSTTTPAVGPTSLVLRSSRVSRNTAQVHGGVAWLDRLPGQLLMADVEMVENKALSGSGGVVYVSKGSRATAEGGALAIWGTRTKGSTAGVSSRTIDRSRELMVRAAASGVTLSRTSFSSARSAGGDGGAVLLDLLTRNGWATLVNSSFNGCGAAASGGAARLQLAPGTRVEVLNSSFAGSTANQDGGAVSYVQLTAINGSSSSGCDPAMAASAVSSGLMVVTESRFNANQAGAHGGALHISEQGAAMVSACTFHDNAVLSGAGGAVSAVGCRFVRLRSSQLLGGRAATLGGGAALLGCDVAVLEGCELKGNEALADDSKVYTPPVWLADPDMSALSVVCGSAGAAYPYSASLSVRALPPGRHVGNLTLGGLNALCAGSALSTSTGRGDSAVVPWCDPLFVNVEAGADGSEASQGLTLKLDRGAASWNRVILRGWPGAYVLFVNVTGVEYPVGLLLDRRAPYHSLPGFDEGTAAGAANLTAAAARVVADVGSSCMNCPNNAFW